ncbi:hypothetical protein GCM10027159_28190 [Lysobacter terrae]
MRRATRNQQEVVAEHLAAGERERMRIGIDADDLAEPHFHIALVAQDVPQRRGDIWRRQARGRDLVQQGLKEMVIASIDQGDTHVVPGQGPCRPQTGETAADDHDVR